MILQEMERKDWLAVHEYTSQHIVCKYQPWGPTTKADTKAFVDQILIDSQHHPRTRFVSVVVLPDSHKIISAEVRAVYHKTK